MPYVQQNGNGTLSVNLPKRVIVKMCLKKGDELVFSPIEGKDNEFRVWVNQ